VDDVASGKVGAYTDPNSPTGWSLQPARLIDANTGQEVPAYDQNLNPIMGSYEIIIDGEPGILNNPEYSRTRVLTGEIPPTTAQAIAMPQGRERWTFVTPEAAGEMGRQTGKAAGEAVAETPKLNFELGKDLWKDILKQMPEMKEAHSPAPWDDFLKMFWDPISQGIDTLWQTYTDNIPKNPGQAWDFSKKIIGVGLPVSVAVFLTSTLLELPYFTKRVGFHEFAKHADKLFGWSKTIETILSAPISLGFMPWLKRHLDLTYRTKILGTDEIDELYMKGDADINLWASHHAWYGLPDDLRTIHAKGMYREPRYFELSLLAEFGYVPDWFLKKKLQRALYDGQDQDFFLKTFKRKGARDIIDKLTMESINWYQWGHIESGQFLSNMAALDYPDEVSRSYLGFAMLKKARDQRRQSELDEESDVKRYIAASLNMTMEDYEEDAIDSRQLISNLDVLPISANMKLLYREEALWRWRRRDRREKEKEEDSDSKRVISVLKDEARRDYIDGYITESQLNANLKALGLSDLMVKVYSAEAALHRRREHNRTIERTLEDAYLKDVINDEELAWQLFEFIPVGEVLQEKLARLKMRKQPKRKIPEVATFKQLSESKLVQAMHGGIISADQLASALLEKGYRPGDVEILIRTELAKRPVSA